jgi:hypothetical protein
MRVKRRPEGSPINNPIRFPEWFYDIGRDGEKWQVKKNMDGKKVWVFDRKLTKLERERLKKRPKGAPIDYPGLFNEGVKKMGTDHGLWEVKNIKGQKKWVKITGEIWRRNKEEREKRLRQVDLVLKLIKEGKKPSTEKIRKMLSVKKRSPKKRKSPKKKSTIKKPAKTKSPKSNSPKKRKSPKKKSPIKKQVKRKSPKSNSPKRRKSPKKRKSP